MIVRTKQPDGTWKIVSNNNPYITDLTSEQRDALKGEKGDKGDIGDPGIQGDSGEDGKSAYEIAVEKGFPGDEDAWLESLKGQDGQDAIAAINPRGNWDIAETYQKSDYITASNGNSYTSIIDDNIGNDPTDLANIDKWQVIALKGAPGDTGETPSITMTASVISSIGDPTINVTKSGTDQEPVFNLEFSGIGAGDDPNYVRYPDVKKVDMNAYIEEVEEIIADPELVKYPDIQEVDLDAKLQEIDEKIQEQITNPDFIKYQDVNLFDMDGYVQGITDRQDELDENYGKLTELDFDILTATTEVDTDKTKSLDVSIERDDQNFNFKFQGMVAYDSLEEVDLTEWAGEIVTRQDQIESKYDELAEIDVEKIEGDIEYIKGIIDSGGMGAKIEDDTVSTDSTWSSQKINDEFNPEGIVHYPDIKKVDMNVYLEEIEEIIADPELVKYPDIQEVDLDGKLQEIDEKIEEQMTNPDFLKYTDVNVFDMDGYVQGITDRQDEIEENYGQLTELDFDILTATAEVDTDKTKELAVTIERDDQNFNFKFQGMVTYDSLEEVDLSEWAGEIVTRQDQIENKYNELAEIDVNSLEERIRYLEELIEASTPTGVPELTDERIVGKLNGKSVYEKLVICNVTKTDATGSESVADLSGLNISDIISCDYSSKRADGNSIDLGNHYYTSSNYCGLYYSRNTKNLNLYWYLARETGPIYVTIRYTKVD